MRTNGHDNPYEDAFEQVDGIFAPREIAHYLRWRVEIRLTDLILGGAPKQADTLMSWLRSRFEAEDDLRAKLFEHVRMQGIDVAETATIEQIWEQLRLYGAEQHGNGFLRDERGVFAPGRCMKSSIKEAANTRFAGERWGPRIKNAAGEESSAGRKGVLRVVAERLFVLDAKLHMLRKTDDGGLEPLADADGTLLHIGHPDGPRGRVSTLNYFDFCRQPWVVFTLQAPPDFPTEEQVIDILTEAQFHGLWAGRSLGYGQFRVTGFDRV